MAVPQTLGERLQQAREAKRYDQAAVAAAAKVHPKTVSRWENNRGEPNARRLKAVAELLEVSEPWLRYGDESAPLPLPVPPAHAAAPQPQRLPAWLRGLVLGYVAELEAQGIAGQELQEIEDWLMSPVPVPAVSRGAVTREEAQARTIHEKWRAMSRAVYPGLQLSEPPEHGAPGAPVKRIAIADAVVRPADLPPHARAAVQPNETAPAAAPRRAAGQRGRGRP